MKERPATNNLSVVFIVLLTLVAVLPGCKEAEERLDSYMQKAVEAWGFQGAVLVAVDGEVILSKGYGFANRTFEEPNTPETKYFIGSITKQFTAAAILLLHERGKLDLDAPISRYLPEYPRKAAEIITIHHLLSHTAGLPNYTEVPEIFLNRVEPISQSDIITTFRDRGLEFEPGTDFHYSNSGYIILGAIIERLSGQSYEAFLNHEIFVPLGMENTGYARREMALPNTAEGYTIDETGQLYEAVEVHMSRLFAAGALYSTVEDMLKWDRALREHSLLDEESVKLMLSPNNWGYGFGWFIESLYNRRHTFHGGFLDGFNTTIERWPDQQLLVVVFSNEDEMPVKKIARSLAAILFGESYVKPVRKEAVEVEADLLADYEGVYQSQHGYNRYIVLDSDTLHTFLRGEPRQHLLPESPERFFLQWDNTVTLTFDRGDDSAVTGYIERDEDRIVRATKLSGEAAQFELLRLEAIELDSSVYRRYTGIYRLTSEVETDESRFYLAVSYVDNQFLVSVSGQPPIELFAVSETQFSHREADFRVEFTLDEDDQVTGCVLHLAGAEVTGTKVE